MGTRTQGGCAVGVGAPARDIFFFIEVESTKAPALPTAGISYQLAFAQPAAGSAVRGVATHRTTLFAVGQTAATLERLPRDVPPFWETPSLIF